MSLQQAAAQAAPPVTFQQPSAPPLATLVSAGAGKSPGTKVVRIYRGPGRFDEALAAKLYPMLAKAFPFARPEPLQTAQGAPGTAPAKLEDQKKVAAAHL